MDKQRLLMYEFMWFLMVVLVILICLGERG